MDANNERIEAHLKQMFGDRIDLSDLGASAIQETKDAHFRTRALSAYSLVKEIDISTELAADSVVDGGQDYGIDAIFFHSTSKTLYVVQSKFFGEATKGMEKGEVLTFIDGVRLLFNEQLDRANPRLAAKLPTINSALNEPDTTVTLIIVSTGLKLTGESKEPIDRFVTEKNSQSDEQWLKLNNLSNSELLDLIASDNAPKGHDVEVSLKNWGSLATPHKAFYGQLSALELGKWFQQYGKDLVSANIRSYLGAATDVNKKIGETLNSNPSKFFYLNNGITAISNVVVNTNKFADSKDAGSFECKNIKIVNGAQTYGSIGRAYKENQETLKDAWVMFKIISVGESGDTLRELVTVATNSQNRIESIDFASMDSQQIRLETELLRNFGMRYVRLRDELGEPYDETEISITDAASALVCFEDDVKICTNHKREINKIWDDLKSPPYTTVFSPSTTSKKLVNCVSLMRRLRSYIIEKKLKKGREATFSKSGDHFLLHMVMTNCPDKMATIQKIPDEFNAYLDSNFKTIADKVYNKTWEYMKNNDPYKTAQLARLLISPKLVVGLKSHISAILAK